MSISPHPHTDPPRYRFSVLGEGEGDNYRRPSGNATTTFLLNGDKFNNLSGICRDGRDSLSQIGCTSHDLDPFLGQFVQMTIHKPFSL